MSSLTAAETLKQGHRLFSVILMLRGSSAHSINDRPSYILFTIAILQSRVIQSTHLLLDHHDNCSVVDSSCFIALIIYQSSWYMPCILSLLCALLNFQNRLQC